MWAGPRRDRNAIGDALTRMLQSSGPLYHRVEADATMSLLFVHLDSLFLSGEYANKRFQINLRYGNSGTFMEKYSQKVTAFGIPEEQTLIQQGAVVQMHSLVNSPELNGCIGVCEQWLSERGRWNVRLGSGDVKAVQLQNLNPMGSVVANFSNVIIFNWDTKLAPLLTLEVLKLGAVDKSLARTTVRLPFRSGRPGVAEQEVLLTKKENHGCCMIPFRKPRTNMSEVLGHLGIVVELQQFSRDELEFAAGMPESIDRMITSLGAFQQPTPSPVVLVMETMIVDGDARTRPDSSSRGFACSPQGFTGVSGATLGNPVLQPNSSSQGLSAGSSAPVGGTTFVTGRPVPGAGWSWNGQSCYES